MTSVLRMHAALRAAARLQQSPVSLRKLARAARVSPTTLSTAMVRPVDLHLSTLTRIWKALGYDVTIWCQSPGRTAFLFDTKGVEDDD